MAWRRTLLALVAVAAAAAAATRADAWHNYGAAKFTVTGSVLCQDCTKSWNAYAYNAKPIPGSLRATASCFLLARRLMPCTPIVSLLALHTLPEKYLILRGFILVLFLNIGSLSINIKVLNIPL
jgi:hypothetical protein